MWLKRNEMNLINISAVAVAAAAVVAQQHIPLINK